MEAPHSEDSMVCDDAVSSSDKDDTQSVSGLVYMGKKVERTNSWSPKWNMEKETQINLHYSKAAFAALLLRVSERGKKFVMVQEP